MRLLWGPPNVERLKARGKVKGLITALRYKGKEFTVRREAATVLGQLGDSQAVGPLITALQDQDSTVRQAVATALGQLGDSQAVGPLITALLDQSRSPAGRQAAATALAQLGDLQAVEPLITALERTQHYIVRQAAAAALKRLGWQPDRSEAAALYYITILQDQNSAVRQAAASALGQLGALQAVEPLTAALHASNALPVRKAIATALLMIYRSARLDEIYKRRILTHRITIMQRHVDSEHHIDQGIKGSYSDCSHTDHVEHRDTGIGIDFPI